MRIRVEQLQDHHVIAQQLADLLAVLQARREVEDKSRRVLPRLDLACDVHGVEDEPHLVGLHQGLRSSGCLERFRRPATALSCTVASGEESMWSSHDLESFLASYVTAIENLLVLVLISMSPRRA